MLIYALLGGGALALRWSALQSWFLADWTHGGFVVAAILLVLSFGALYRVEVELAEPLTLVADADWLSEARPTHLPGLSMAAGHVGHTFAVLRVTNGGDRSIPRLIATAQVGAEECRCFWSSEPGERFSNGGTHGAELSAGDYRILVIAQAFCDPQAWMKLSGAPLEDVPLTATSKTEGVRHFSRYGEQVDLPIGSTITVQFRAEGLRQTARFLLGFGDKGEAKVVPLRRSPR